MTGTSRHPYFAVAYSVDNYSPSGTPMNTFRLSRTRRVVVCMADLALIVGAAFYVVRCEQGGSARYSVNDALWVHLGEASAPKTETTPSSPGFPMKVVVTQAGPDSLAFEGIERISVSDGREWTRLIRGKVRPTDVHAGAIIYTGDVFALEYATTRPEKVTEPRSSSLAR
jgi:hypothetical protein